MTSFSKRSECIKYKGFVRPFWGSNQVYSINMQDYITFLKMLNTSLKNSNVPFQAWLIIYCIVNRLPWGVRACSVQSAYGVGLVDIFVQGTAWVAEGGGGVLKCAACSHMLSTVQFVKASVPPQWKSMFRWELIVLLGLGLFDVVQSPPNVYSQLSMWKLQSTQVNVLEKKQGLPQRWRSELFWSCTSKKNRFNFAWTNYIRSQDLVSTELSSLLRF